MIEISDVKRLWLHANKAYGLESSMQIGDNFFTYSNEYDMVIVEIQHDTKKVIISYRGTRGWKAWKEDFDAIDRVEFAKHQARVHEGFWEGFLALRNEVWNIICEWSAKGYAIEFTGHSRGGALCTIAAWRLWEDMKIGSMCVPFAAPRQGGKRYAAAIEDIDEINFLSVQTKYDIVTKVPPVEWGYAHVSPVLVLHTSSFPFLPLLRGIINHTQKMYTKCIDRL